ncbi:MAG: Sas10/Utp3/C1D family-domain-containing protein [Monoraphidium minutum]|nr:MAG: Sas10/Utp3/C1D family-domain-containing protein [Monoraphidium minutum]
MVRKTPAKPASAMKKGVKSAANSADKAKVAAKAPGKKHRQPEFSSGEEEDAFGPGSEEMGSSGQEDGGSEEKVSEDAGGRQSGGRPGKQQQRRRRQQQESEEEGSEEEEEAGPSGSGSDTDEGEDGGGGGADADALARRLDELTSDERTAAVLADAPELVSLLADMRAALAEVRGRVGPLLEEVRGGGLATAEGLSYLEAKHLLLLQYCGALLVYVMLRAEGGRVEGHPVIGRLVQLRAYIERTRPIDKQLAYQIDKLLRTADGGAGAAAAAAAAADEELLPTTDELAGGDTALNAPRRAASSARGTNTGGGGEDDLAYRPNPSALVTKAPLAGGFTPADGGDAGLEGAGGGGGVYRPPRLNPVAMEEDLEQSRAERRRVVEMRRRAKRSSLVKELARELEGAPEEVEALLPGLDSAAATAARARLDARAAQEEELMMRVPLGKTEVKRLKAQRRAGMSGQGLMDDFETEVADLVGSAAAGGRRQGRQQQRGGGGGDGFEDGLFGGRRGGGDFEGDGGFKRPRPGGGGGDELLAASKAARAAAKGQKRRRP